MRTLNLCLMICSMYVAGNAQIVQSFEVPSRSVLTDSCYGHPGSTVHTRDAINGKSFRTGQLSSTTMNHGLIFPWIHFDGNDTIEFSHKTSNSSGNYLLTVYTIDEDDKIIDTIFDFSYNRRGNVFNETIVMKDSGVRRLRFAFNGTGGSGRGILDDITISGEWATNFETCEVSETFNPLPVSLLHFSGERVQEGNLLSWATASEINNMGFELYRSTDGITFENIAWIDGNGNSSQRLEYQYFDLGAHAELTYYYIRQVDYDGQSEVFPKIVIGRGKNKLSETKVFPNPASNYVYIEQSDARQEGTFILTDLSGRVLLQQPFGGHSLNRISFDNLPNGVYFYQIHMLNGKDVTSGRLSIRPE